MPRTLLLVALLAVLAAAGLCFSFWADRDAPTSELRRVDRPPAEEADAVPTAEAPAPTEAPAVVERTAVADGAQPPAPTSRAIDRAALIVTVLADGEPVEGARLRGWGDGASLALGTTDTEGRVRAELDPGAALVLLYASATPTTAEGSARPELRLRAGREHAATVKVERGVDLAGRVVDGDGRPVSEVHVYCWFDYERGADLRTADRRVEVDDEGSGEGDAGND